MAKGKSQSNREVKKPKKSKEIMAPPSVLSATPPKVVTPTPEAKKK